MPDIPAPPIAGLIADLAGRPAVARDPISPDDALLALLARLGTGHERMREAVRDMEGRP